MSFQLGRLRIGGEDRYRWVPEERIVQMLILAGYAHEQESAQALRESQEALFTWITLGLPFVQKNGERLFDPVEVTNFLKWAGLTGSHPFWEERYLTTGRRFIRELAASSASLAEGERTFNVTMARTFNLRGVASGEELRLRLPLPLEGHQLRELEVDASSTRPGAKVAIRPGRLEVRASSGIAEEITVSARLKFLASPQQPTIVPVAELPDKELYLRPRDGLIVVSDRVRGLSQSLAGSGVDSAQAVRCFWEHINKELVCGAVHYDQITAEAPGDWVLENGWFDCQLGAALFASLCRARGIPARLKGGRVLYPFAPADHYWAEAWLEGTGWMPFDFLSWDLSRGGKDAEWRDCFYGRLDQRMTTECLPREFTGYIGVPIPRAWTLLQRGRDGGLETTMVRGAGGVIYTDLVHLQD